MELSSSLHVLNGNDTFLAAKRIALLEAIYSEGSISKAAKKVPMSYKAAWDAVDAMNNLSNKLIVTRETGGKGGGGAKLTPYGENLVNCFTLMQKEHQKFLQTLSKMSDFDSGAIQTIERLSMKLSARNQIEGKIEHITKGKVNCEVFIKLKSGYTMVSVITNAAANELGLQIGDSVVGIFKSSAVLITTDIALNISARNKFKGIVASITQGGVNAQIVIDIGAEKIASVITNGAVENLGLKKGDEVCALIKSNDIMIGV